MNDIIPDKLVKPLYRVFQQLSTPQFNEMFKHEELSIYKKSITYGNPEEILGMANKIY